MHVDAQERGKWGETLLHSEITSPRRSHFLPACLLVFRGGITHMYMEARGQPQVFRSSPSFPLTEPKTPDP